MGIRLPERGTKQNQASFYVAVDAVDGPLFAPGIYNRFTHANVTLPVQTQQTPIGISQPVGVLSRPSVTWRPVFAGRYTQISWTFVNYMVLEVGDVFGLYLPSLEGDSSNFTAAFYRGVDQLSINGTFDDRTGVVSFVVNARVEIDTSCQINTPANANIRLPTVGVMANTVGFMAWAKALDGFSLNQISNTGVGAILKSSVDFAPKKANFSTTVSVRFISTTNFSENDLISIYLHGFQGTPGFNLTSIDGNHHSSSLDVLWSVMDVNFAMLLRVTFPIPRLEEVAITLPQSSGIRSPREYHEKNDPRHKISVVARLGTIPVVAIQESPPMGSFKRSYIYFNPATAGEVNDIYLHIVTSMKIVPGDSIELHLPGLSGPDCVSTPSSMLRLNAS